MFTKFFQKLSKKDAAIAGGKGASLGEMTRAGIPVPPGFVILIDAFERFTEETDINIEIDAALDAVNHKEIHTVEKAAETIQSLIIGSAMPKDIEREILSAFKKLRTRYVAVRSSATAEDGREHAWAGQLESYLNTTRETLLRHVQKCWASLFTPRAIFYRFEKGLHGTKISVAVVVQKMVESEKAGIAFSVHPITEDRNQAIIEAGFGLGEAVVSGSVTPDSYVVEKEPRRIIDVNVSNQTKGLFRKNEGGGNQWRELGAQGTRQVLSKKEILAITEIILRIEQHYGFPCDIEWAHEKGKFYITQSRPITTLASPQRAEKNERGKYAAIHANNYDFLWRVGFNYLICSIYHHAGYAERDFVFTWKDGEHFNFVGKEERKKLSKKGVVFYTKKFDSFKTYVKKNTPRYKTLLREIASRNLKKMSNAELSKSFSELIDLIVRVFKDYFYLEYHSTDEVARIVEEHDARYNVKKLKKELEQMGHIKLALRAVWNAVLYPPNPLEKHAREIATRLSLGEDVFRYKYDELIRMLGGEKVTIPDRSCVVWGKFSNGNDVTGAEAEEIIRRLQNIDPSEKVLKGNIGNKGYYKGTVKKIEFSETTDFKREINEMRKGQVLVSGSTGPEMILACKKAGAIITDEGGVISHAAIVSRELGIPCIIGTKIATQMLKDGDLVKVDAGRGIVTILKSISS